VTRPRSAPAPALAPAPWVRAAGARSGNASFAVPAGQKAEPVEEEAQPLAKEAQPLAEAQPAPTAQPLAQAKPLQGQAKEPQGGEAQDDR